ncbi:MAG: hypothetical protein HDS16_03675 [Bacteroides sp.]|nr:hypothetical protein [Bacteroides sp.]
MEQTSDVARHVPTFGELFRCACLHLVYYSDVARHVPTFADGNFHFFDKRLKRSIAPRIISI